MLFSVRFYRYKKKRKAEKREEDSSQIFFNTENNTVLLSIYLSRICYIRDAINFSVLVKVLAIKVHCDTAAPVGRNACEEKLRVFQNVKWLCTHSHGHKVQFNHPRCENPRTLHWEYSTAFHRHSPGISTLTVSRRRKLGYLNRLIESPFQPTLHHIKLASIASKDQH